MKSTKLVLSGVLALFFTCAGAQYLEPQVIKNSNIIWIGEMHGTAKSYEFSFEIIKEVNETAGLDYLLLESPYLGEININHYLETGSETFLDTIMMNRISSPTYSHEYRSYLKKIYQYNAGLGSEKKIKAVSIDIEHYFPAGFGYIRDKTDKAKIGDASLFISKLYTDYTEHLQWKKGIKTKDYYTNFYKFYSTFFEDINQNEAAYKKLWVNDFRRFKYLVRNCMYGAYGYANDTNNKNWSNIRDSLIYENFKWRNQDFQFETKRAVALWGQWHTLQAKQKNDEVEWIAAGIKRKNPEIKQTTIFSAYLNCGFLVSEGEIPGVIQWMFKKDGKYTRTVQSIINNNGLFFRVGGIKYLKKQATKDVEVFDISKLPDEKNYVFGRDKDLSNLEYAQYVVLIQNSEAATSFNKD